MPTSDTTRDAYCSSLISIYSQAIMNDVNREFAPITGSVGTPTTRRFKLEAGSYRLDLDPYDLQTVSTVTLNPEQASPRTLTINDEYMAQPVTNADGVYTSIEFSKYIIGSFVTQTAIRFGYTLVDVSGVWGFPTVPGPVKQACILSVTSAMRRDVSAFALDTDEAVALATERSQSYGIPPAARRLLNNYRRHVVF